MELEVSADVRRRRERSHPPAPPSSLMTGGGGLLWWCEAGSSTGPVTQSQSVLQTPRHGRQQLTCSVRPAVSQTTMEGNLQQSETSPVG